MVEDIELRRLSDKIDALTLLVQERITRPSQGKFINRSEKLNELADALAKAQSIYKPITMDNVNTYSKVAFASLTRITEATREALTNNGLSVLQDIFDHEDGSSVLHTLLLHTSDQFVESQFRLKPNGNDPHSLTSYINWAKRTNYSSLVGCPIPNEDDDAEAYSAPERKTLAKGSAGQRKDMSYEVISKTQLEELEYELDGFPNIAEQILDYYNLQNIADLPADKYRVCITRARELKTKIRSNKE